ARRRACVHQRADSALPTPTSAHPPPSPLSLHDALPISHRAQAAHHIAGLGRTGRLREHRHGIVRARKNRRAEGERAVAADRKIIDRKSTRLNSSHLGISYAVFCLKKNNE